MLVSHLEMGEIVDQLHGVRVAVRHRLRLQKIILIRRVPDPPILAVVICKTPRRILALPIPIRHLVS